MPGAHCVEPRPGNPSCPNRTYLTGSNKSCVKYCKKANEFEEAGALCQGLRPDLDGARETAVSTGMRAVASIYNYQAIRVAEKHLSYNERERHHAVEVIWFYGPAGSGKTRAIYERIETNMEDAYWKPPESKWFDGYDQHEILVLDDLRSTWFGFSFLLRLLDRYPMRIENKGGHRQMLCRKVYISSIEHPREFLPADSGEPVQQLLRRIKEIIRFSLLVGVRNVPLETPGNGLFEAIEQAERPNLGSGFPPLLDENLPGRLGVPDVSVPEVEGNNIPQLQRTSQRLWPVNPLDLQTPMPGTTNWPSSVPYNPSAAMDWENEVLM